MTIKKTLDDLRSLTTLKDQLILILSHFPRHYMKILKSPAYAEFDFMNKICLATPLLADDYYTIHTKIYWIINDITDFSKCENPGCTNPAHLNVISAVKGYPKIQACSPECHKHVAVLRVEESNLKKYGQRNMFAVKKDKIRQTNIAKYGTACPANNSDIRKDICLSNRAKYGVDHYSQTSEWKDKMIMTNNRKFGCDYATQNADVMNRIKTTNLERYGTQCVFNSPEISAKIVAGYIEKYGDDYKQAVWGNSGNDGQIRRSYKYMCSNDFVKPRFSVDDLLEFRHAGISEFEFECLKCHNSFMSTWNDGHTSQCPYCSNFAVGKSEAEIEIFKWLSDTIPNSRFSANNRMLIGPNELDIVDDSRKIAIEYDGLYWHNDDNKPDYKYHLTKTRLCEEKGYQLIHIFENEWICKQEIVKSRLKTLFGVHDRTVYARNCTLAEISSRESNAFQDENHIQGSVNSSVNIGLKFKDELISVMTFGRSRYSSKCEWELLRFCNKLGYHIPGAAGKLLKYFERIYSPKSLISYADRRWSRGKLYYALGFSFDHETTPNYWYFKDNTLTLESRVKYQKHKLKNLLENFDENLTESENMKNNGYSRIYDCGNLVFVKVY